MYYSVFDYNNSDDYFLLIHGLGADESEFFRQVKEFGKFYKVITFDLNGYGRSVDCKDKPFTIEQCVADIKEFLDFRDIKKVHMLGHSMGGMISIEFASQYPEYVDKLVLVDTCADIWDNAIGYAMLKPVVMRFKFFADNMSVFKDHKLWEFVFDLYTRNLTNLNWYKATLLYALSIAKWQRLGGLCKIRAKTMVVQGKYDHLIYGKSLDILLDHIDDVIGVVMTQSEHSPNVVEYKLFNDYMLTFLKGR